MINHVRTLLANLPPSNGSNYLAEEIVDPAFIPVVLTTELQFLRSLLCGGTPDRHMINYRCRQLLTAVHASPWTSYIYDLDPRVTYSIGQDDSLVLPVAFLPNVKGITAPSDVVTIAGGPAAPDFNGRLGYDFTVIVEGGPQLAVTDNVTNQNLVFGLTFNSGMSNFVPLGDSGYLISVPDTVGAQWLISVFNKPHWDLGQLVTNLAYGGTAHFDYLFGLDAIEPWITFRNLWEQSPDLPDKVSGFVLAYTYRTDTLRLK
jgi:hypothetical protein